MARKPLQPTERGLYARCCKRCDTIFKGSMHSEICDNCKKKKITRATPRRSLRSLLFYSRPALQVSKLRRKNKGGLRGRQESK